MSLAVMDRQSEVMARARGGDADAFAALVDPVLDRAYRLAAVMLADRAAAEDAVQEASVKAWRKLPNLRGNVESFTPWFLSIVANECRMTRRARWWSVLKFADIRSEPASAASESSDLHRALLKLHPDERLALVLFFYLDLPLKEVATVLRVSPAAAKARIYRSAKRMRADLTPEEVI